MTNPIAPINRRVQNDGETETGSSQSQSGLSSQVEGIRNAYGIEFNPSSPITNEPKARNIINSGNVVADISNENNRLRHSGIEITFLNGNHRGEKLALGTDVQKISQSQTANWSDKDGQKMRSGINFNNISPRSVSFTCDLYHPNQDITPAAENIAHLQEISAGTNNEPPLVFLQVGKTSYNNAVCTEYKCDYESPLPDVRRNGEEVVSGFRRAKINLSFKIAGGAGSQYQFAAPFNDDTQLQGLFDNKSAEEAAKIGTQKTAETVLSDCLSEGENREFLEAFESDRLNDPNTYQTISSNVFMQLAASNLPSNILSDAGFQSRLKRELANKVASEQRDKQGFTNAQISDALVTPQPLPGFEDFDALLVVYSQVYNAIVNNNINSLGLEGNNLLNKASKCGRTLRESGGLRLATADTGVDPAFTTKNLNKLIKTTSVSELRSIFGMGTNVPDQTISDIKKHSEFENKDEFVSVVSQSTDALTGYTAWAAFEENEKGTLEELNSFLTSAADADEVKDRLKGSSAVATALLGQTFSSKEEFLRRVLSVLKPNKPFTFDEGLRRGNSYWVNFTKA